MVDILSFLRLTAKFFAVLRLTVNPIETLTTLLIYYLLFLATNIIFIVIVMVNVIILLPFKIIILLWTVQSWSQGVMVPGVLCVDRGNWDENATLLRARDCEGRFWHIHIRLMRSSGVQRCRSLSKRVGPRITLLKGSQVSSCSKRSREITTEPIAALTKIGSVII